jgi:hypothetical protein
VLIRGGAKVSSLPIGYIAQVRDSRTCHHSVPSHARSLQAASIRPNGSEVAVASKAGKVHVYTLSGDTLAEKFVSIFLISHDSSAHFICCTGLQGC